jgi:hypothetical protein
MKQTQEEPTPRDWSNVLFELQADSDQCNINYTVTEVFKFRLYYISQDRPKVSGYYTTYCIHLRPSNVPHVPAMAYL